jgi:hypothetical protein
MKNKIRFKKHPEVTGLASVGAGDPDIDIKINGKVCGYIAHPNWSSSDKRIRIKLSVNKEIEGKPNFEWITLKYIPENDEQAREFLKKYVDEIVKKHNLYYFED